MYNLSNLSNNEMKTVLILINHYLPGYKSGGPIQTISSIVSHLGDEVDFKIITTDRDAMDSKPYSSIKKNNWNKVGNADVYYLEKKWNLALKLIKNINKIDYNILYLNSFFNPAFTLVPLFAKRLRLISDKTIILAPRGELSVGALSIKKSKKRIAINIFKFINLFKDVVWHVSSDLEKREVIDVMSAEKDDVKVAPNLSSTDKKIDNIRFNKKGKNELKIIYLSRITPKKNLAFALRVLMKIDFSIEFKIVGPIRDNKYWEMCKSIIEGLPSNIIVKYIGGITHNKVLETISKSDLFFLPTKGENFGHVILEAAMAGTPLLISDTTPWVDLEANGVGWELPLENENAFIDKINYINEMNEDCYTEMTEKVIRWAEKFNNTESAIESNKLLFK